MDNTPISQKYTINRFLNSGWKIVDREGDIVFIKGLDGRIRVIDNYGYMWFIAKFIEKRGSSDKLEKWLDYNTDLYYKKRGLYR